MASLDVSHDDMIDMLIGHANMPIPHNQRSHPGSHPGPPHLSQHPPPLALHQPPHNNHGQNPMGSPSHPMQSYHHHHQMSPHYVPHHHQNPVGPHLVTAQNHVHHGMQNQVSSPLGSQNQVITPPLPPQPPQNQVMTSHTPVITSTQNQVTSSHNQVVTSTQSQVATSAPNPVQLSTSLTYHGESLTHEPNGPLQVPPSSVTQLSSPEPQLSELSSPDQVDAEQSPVSTENQPVSKDTDDVMQFATNDLADVKPLPTPLQHNQYLCPGCQKSILYTNRSSLVQLLSLHQEKCPGTRQYRYMCLECHSAFRTVSQLQEHEDICGPGTEGQKQSLNESDKPDDMDVSAAGDVLKDQEVPVSKVGSEEEDVKPPIGLTELEGNQDDEGGEKKVSVRESWTQTYDQPKPERKEIVDVLLDEISPAGRKRRMCTRKVKVYNEKSMAHLRESAELEMIKVVSGKKSAKACKKDLKRFDRGTKMKKQLLTGENPVNPSELQGKPAKPEKVKKIKKEKEQELEVPMHCQLCPKTFTKYSMYTKHYQLNHEKAMCQYCGTQCVRKKLKQHEKSHLKVFQCTYPGCSKVVNSKHRLKRHSRVHTGEKPFECDICKKPFAGKENMVKHKKRVHDKERKYQCRFCGQKFADKGGLKYHENTHIKQRPTDYRCKYCGRGYKSHVGCYLHERTHTGNMYKCGFCGKEFMAKVHLRKHEYIHTGNYPFRCMNCQKGFPNNGAMKKHKCLALL